MKLKLFFFECGVPLWGFSWTHLGHQKRLSVLLSSGGALSVSEFRLADGLHMSLLYLMVFCLFTIAQRKVSKSATATVDLFIFSSLSGFA